MSEILERLAALDRRFLGRSRPEPDEDETLGLDPSEDVEAVAAEAFDTEIGDPFGDDATIELGADGTSDLITRISTAGFQVLQAAEGLEQAAAMLRVVEALARDADERVRKVEGRLAEADAERRDLAELLELARAEQALTDERATAAEQRADATDERLRQALARVEALEAQLAEHETGPASPSRPQLTVIVDGERDELRTAVASEIRRPLSSILGLALALKHADTGTGDGKAMLRRLEASARRLERLVVQLIELDGSGSGEGTLSPSRRRVDVEALVRRVVEDTPDLADLDVQLRSERVTAEIDAGLTEQMVEALLANAARRSSQSGRVEVEVAAERNGVRISVDDGCPDVPPGLSGEPSRGNPRRRPSLPTGLVLLNRLAEVHGGRVWAEPRPGGASFRLFLPASAAAAGVAPPAWDDELEPDGPDGNADDDGTHSAVGGRDLSSFDDLSDELAI